MKNLYNQLILSDNPLESARILLAPNCMEKLKMHINNCKCCGYNYNKKNCYGNPNANIFIINDIATDDMQINDFFYKYLKTSNIDFNDVFIINSVSCICKIKEANELILRIPTSKEIKSCKTFIDYAIDFVKPRIIISMGEISFNQYYDNEKFSDEIINNTFNMYNTLTYLTYSINDVFDCVMDNNPQKANEYAKHIIDTFKMAQYVINALKDK